MHVHHLHSIYLAQLVNFTRNPQGFLKLETAKGNTSDKNIRNSINQPVKPKQTLTLFQNSSSTEDTGRYLLTSASRPCHLVATATTRDVSPAATQVVKAFKFW